MVQELHPSISRYRQRRKARCLLGQRRGWVVTTVRLRGAARWAVGATHLCGEGDYPIRERGRGGIRRSLPSFVDPPSDIAAYPIKRGQRPAAVFSPRGQGRGSGLACLV
jgi:hypothetical protein